jgi:hypothetical protein
MTNAYIEDNLRRIDRITGIYSPNDMAKCIRLLYLMYSNLVKTDEIVDGKVDDVFGIFEAGKMVEEWVGKVLAHYLKKNSNLELTNTTQRNITQIIDDNQDAPVQLNGKSDYLVMLRDRQDRRKSLLLEIKSIASVRKLESPIEDHKVQIMPYILALRPLEARIVYVERMNYLHQKEFEISYQADVEYWLTNRVKQLDGYLRRGEIPPPEARLCVKCHKGILEKSKTSTKMVYCPECKVEYDEGITELWRMDYCPAGPLCCKNFGKVKKDESTQTVVTTPSS